MKVKVILPPVSKAGLNVPSLGLGTLMASLDASDEIVVTAEQAQQSAMWEDADVVVITVGPMPMHALNLAELYRLAGTHVVLIGNDLGFVADAGKKGETVFLGAADELWPAFLRDLRERNPGQCYASEFELCGYGVASADPVHAA